MLENLEKKLTSNIDKIGMVYGFTQPMSFGSGDVLGNIVGEIEQIISNPTLSTLNFANIKNHWETFGKGPVMTNIALMAMGLISDAVYPNKWSKLATKFAMGGIKGNLIGLALITVGTQPTVTQTSYTSGATLDYM